MKKIAKKIGKAIVIQFSKEEQKVYGIKRNKVYDIEITEVNYGKDRD